MHRVALRKESVDRNCELPSNAGEFLVALRKESVDRNTLSKNPMISINKVALRKESVDRNEHAEPSRQAQNLVALRKESVDRNVDPDADTLIDDGRSPQGERG